MVASREIASDSLNSTLLIQIVNRMKINSADILWSTLFLHGVCMLRECIYGECVHEQHVRRTLTLTLTHTITAYSVSGNVVRVRILICARQKPCRKRVYHILLVLMSRHVR